MHDLQISLMKMRYVQYKIVFNCVTFKKKKASLESILVVKQLKNSWKALSVMNS